MEILRNIGLCIDLKCSGNNMVGNKIYRVFNSFFELRDHFRTKHEKIINENSVLLNFKNKNLKLLLKKYGSCSEHYYIEERSIKDDINIIKYDEFMEKEKNQKIENKVKSNNKKFETINENSDNSHENNDEEENKKIKEI